MSIPGYDQLHPIARNAFHGVYRAREVASGRLVCLEVHRAWSRDFEGTSHLRILCARAEAVAVLDHPNLWAILRIGECERGWYLVRPWYDGPMLDLELRERRPSVAVAVDWVRQLALAAQHAHEHGIYHCDIKPANVRLRPRGDGSLVPLLTDFHGAVVRFLPPPLQEKGAAVLLGTPAYMAPEQVMGQRDKIGAATDVWALGGLLYQMLAGRLVFEGRSAIDLLQTILQLEPVRLREVVPGIDDNLDRICRKCLSKKPEQRYASAAELADDLERHLRGERPVAERTRRLGGWVRGLWGVRGD